MLCACRDKRLTQFPAAALFSKISMGTDSACGIFASNSSVQCWGEALSLQTGTPALTFSEVAVGASAFISGFGFACGVTTSNTISCWGNNKYVKVACVFPDSCLFAVALQML